MNDTQAFYQRYWQDEHIKVNPFDHHPLSWDEANFKYHLDFFKPFINGNLLDFGCGSGEFANRIRPYCTGVWGVDIVENIIFKAKSDYPHVNFKVLDNPVKIPYMDNYFDCISAIDVLEHILDIESLLEEFKRVLKPKGCLLISTSQITRIKLLAVMLMSFDKYFYPASPHIRYFTGNNLKDILQRKLFTTVKYQKNRTYFGFIPQGQLVVAVKA